MILQLRRCTLQNWPFSFLSGLWQELGPCRVNDDGSQAVYNTEGSWNQVSNMLFFDQVRKKVTPGGVENLHDSFSVSNLFSLRTLVSVTVLTMSTPVMKQLLWLTTLFKPSLKRSPSIKNSHSTSLGKLC
jgi:hypothetical protein